MPMVSTRWHDQYPKSSPSSKKVDDPCSIHCRAPTKRPMDVILEIYNLTKQENLTRSTDSETDALSIISPLHFTLPVQVSQTGSFVHWRIQKQILGGSELDPHFEIRNFAQLVSFFRRSTLSNREFLPLLVYKQK